MLPVVHDKLWEGTPNCPDERATVAIVLMAEYLAPISIVEKSLKLEERIILHMAMLSFCIVKPYFLFPVT